MEFLNGALCTKMQQQSFLYDWKLQLAQSICFSSIPLGSCMTMFKMDMQHLFTKSIPIKMNVSLIIYY